MNINATFFIQLFHFLIGYLIIERLLLRPWFNVIRHEDQQRQEQEKLLKIAQYNVTQKERFKEEQWREFQASFAEAMPHVHSQPVSFARKTPSKKSSSTLNHADVTACQKEVEKTLFTRLIHV